MGVFGLTTFIREHERILGKNVTLKTEKELKETSSSSSRVQGVEVGEGETFVIDGWAFIYYLSRNIRLPWVYGGEHESFSDSVKNVVRAFLDVGLKLHFVFDGALQPAKFPTKLKRIASSSIILSQLFFRTSNIARSTSRFLAENRIQPPLYYLATLEALNSFTFSKSSSTTDSGPGPSLNTGNGNDGTRSEARVTIHMADDDADKFAVELAGRLNAYCLSNDSDYIILNCEGYKGYVTFDDLRWVLTPSPASSSLPGGSGTPSDALSSVAPSETSSIADSLDFDDLGFTTVTKKKSKGKSRRNHPHSHSPMHKSILLSTQAQERTEGQTFHGLPPSMGSDSEGVKKSASPTLSLSFTSFHPVDLATLLKLPVSLLPLVASLVGNDFSDASNPSAPGSGDTQASTRSGNGASNKPNRMFFDSRLPANQRTTRVSEALLSVLYPRKHQHPQQQPVNLTGMELITAVVEKLLLRPDLVSGRERERVVEGIVDCVLRYAVVPSLPPEDEEGVEGGGAETVCSLHDADRCPLYLLDALLEGPPEDPEESGEEGQELPPSASSSTTETRLHAQKLHIRSLYINSYRRTTLLPNILNIIGTASFWTPGILEDPDRETCERSVGLGIRKWAYAILEDCVGVGVALGREEEEFGAEEEEDEEEVEEDPDELIDVVEEDSEEDLEEDNSEGSETEEDNDEGRAQRNALSPARMNRLRESLERVKSRDGKHKRVSFADDDYVDGGGLGAGPSSSAKVKGKAKKSMEREEKKSIMAEYVRRGVRVADVGTEIEMLPSLLASSKSTSSPLPNSGEGPFPQLLPTTERLTFFLHAMGSAVPSVLSFIRDRQSPSHSASGNSVLLPIPNLLYIICIRWVVRTMGERSNAEERWTKREARCLLASLLNPSPSSTSSTNKVQADSGEQPQESQPPITLANRHIQLTAQFLTTLSNAILLVQVLLLTDEISTSVLRFSGKRFHRLLQSSHPSSTTSNTIPFSFSSRGTIDDNIPPSPNPSQSSQSTQPPIPPTLQTLGFHTKESAQIFERCSQACEEGLDSFWGIERESKKAKKQAQALAQLEAHKQPSAPLQSQGISQGPSRKMSGKSGAKGSAKGGNSLFALLADMDEGVET